MIWRKMMRTFLVMGPLLLMRTSARGRSEPCSSDCPPGKCVFEGCNGSDRPSCVGGACEFRQCQRPSCEGGACSFTGCSKATCGGGSCHFFDPKDTLKDGYCVGGNCFLEGVQWPSHFGWMLSY